jgi:UDP-N-acetylglucosamine acyltransferase
MAEVTIHPTAVVEADAELGDGVVIGPNCFVGSGVKIGENTHLAANVVVERDSVIGKNNRFYPQCVIGCTPQIYGKGDDYKYGKLVIGDDNVIREHATIHPGMIEDGITRIGNKNFIMIGVHIGHDCVLDNDIIMSNYSQISGHCKIEQGVWFSGMVTVHQFCTIGKWSYATGLTGINHDIPPYLVANGHYPCIVRAVNRRGLDRAGLSDEEKSAVVDIFKKVYREEGPQLNKARELKDAGGLLKPAEEIIDAILRGKEHRFGRHLEAYRSN